MRVRKITPKGELLGIELIAEKDPDITILEKFNKEGIKINSFTKTTFGYKLGLTFRGLINNKEPPIHYEGEEQSIIEELKKINEYVDSDDKPHMLNVSKWAIDIHKKTNVIINRVNRLHSEINNLISDAVKLENRLLELEEKA